MDALRRGSGENVRPAPSVGPPGHGSPTATAGLAPAAEVGARPPMRRAADVAPRPRSAGLSRALNVALALVLLVLAAPLLLLVALAVKLTSPGPALYTQLRVGLDRRARDGRLPQDRRGTDFGGRPFTIYKFRSMYLDAERDGRAVWARPGDPRVTPVGRVLRATRLDELPQLFNVLRGDMNLVGPRPERPTIVMELREHIAEYQARHRVKPGLTGLAQVNLAYDATIEDVRQKVHYDLEYVRRQSVWKDLLILAKTVPVVLFRRGGW
jgi:lipopolysaccharide/colanic/teichoic acid biosynthesis glycosyltransferase